MIHGESNDWSTAQRWKKSYGLDADVGYELSNGTVGYGEQCGLVW